nr:hypothetical protein 12newDp2_00002 [Serratia proteamaculans]
MAGDTLVRLLRCIRMAVVLQLPHQQAAVVEHRDRRGATEQGYAHVISCVMNGSISIFITTQLIHIGIRTRFHSMTLF